MTYEESLIARARWVRRVGETGFTLIELLVVIAVLAILAAIVIFNVTGVTNRGARSQCDTDAHTVQVASDTYYANNLTYATTDGNPGIAGTPATLLQDVLEPAYVHTWPSEKAWSIDNKGTLTNTCS
jgi:prepilin-type N-terminal cleavage/methylation domain-containing protein